MTDCTCLPTIRVQYGGQYEEQQRSFHDLVFVLILAVLLVFIVLLFEFGSFAAPIAILCSALLSTSGVFLALLITGTTFNLSSFMGLIMVIGIVAKNGILLLDADQKFRAEGIPAEQSMLDAGERRLRPIMMTALATVAGMIPLALAWGAGSQMLQPLAIAVIGGILASMVLSLIVTPAVHYYIADGAPAGSGETLPAPLHYLNDAGAFDPSGPDARRTLYARKPRAVAHFGRRLSALALNAPSTPGHNSCTMLVATQLLCCRFL